MLGSLNLAHPVTVSERFLVSRYTRIAVELRHDIKQRTIGPGTRLPGERVLAERFHVNRQTVRSALQELRDAGLVVTDKRGTFAAAEPVPRPEPAASPRQPQFPGGARAPLGSRTQARLSCVSVPPTLAAVLGLPPGEATLVHHHRTLGAAGEFIQDAVSYFTPTALAEIPELGRYQRRMRNHEPDLRLLYQWMAQAGLRPTLRESITVTRREARLIPPGHTRLSVRRQVHDYRGRLLEVTDISFTPGWEELTCEFTSASQPLPLPGAWVTASVN